MRDELNKILQEKYPDILSDMYGDMSQTCMAFGIECPDTWYNLINDTLEGLTKVQKDFDVKIKAQQIKEKYGTLRFYYGVSYGPSWSTKPIYTNILFEKIARAFYKGKLKNVKWIKTLFFKAFRSKKYKRLKDGKLCMNTLHKMGWLSSNDRKVTAEDNLDDCISYVINKADFISERVCSQCATSGTFENPIIQTQGWISYICEKCEEKNKKRILQRKKELEQKGDTKC